MALGFYSATSMQFRNFIAPTIKLTTAHQQLKCRKADKATSAAGTQRTSQLCLIPEYLNLALTSRTRCC